FEAFAAALCPAIFDRNVTTVIPAEFAQPLHESGGPWFPGRCRGCPQKPDDRQSARLLRARRERPCRGRRAEQRDEGAPLHSITSSARCWKNKGTSMPSAFAVLRLMTSSNFVGCSMACLWVYYLGKFYAQKERCAETRRGRPHRMTSDRRHQ